MAAQAAEPTEEKKVATKENVINAAKAITVTPAAMPPEAVNAEKITKGDKKAARTVEAAEAASEVEAAEQVTAASVTAQAAEAVNETKVATTAQAVKTAKRARVSQARPGRPWRQSQ